MRKRYFQLFQPGYCHNRICKTLASENRKTIFYIDSLTTAKKYPIIRLYSMAKHNKYENFAHF